MVGTILLGILILVTLISLFTYTKNAQKGFYLIGVLGILLTLVLILTLSGIFD